MKRKVTIVIYIALLIGAVLFLFIFGKSKEKDITNSKNSKIIQEETKNTESKNTEIAKTAKDIYGFMIKDYTLEKSFFEDLNGDGKKDIIGELKNKLPKEPISIVFVAINKGENYRLVESIKALGIFENMLSENISLVGVSDGVVTIKSETVSIGAKIKSTEKFVIKNDDMICISKNKEYFSRGLHISDEDYDFLKGVGTRKDYDFFYQMDDEEYKDKKVYPEFISYNVKTNKPYSLKLHLEKVNYNEEFIKKIVTDKTTIKDFTNSEFDFSNINNLKFYNLYYNDEKYFILDIYSGDDGKKFIGLYSKINDELNIFINNTENTYSDDMEFSIIENKIFLASYKGYERQENILIETFDITNFGKEELFYKEYNEAVIRIGFFGDEFIYKVDPLYSTFYRLNLNTKEVIVIGKISGFY